MRFGLSDSGSLRPWGGCGGSSILPSPTKKVMKIINFLKSIRRSFYNYGPLIEVLISKDALIGNLNEFKKNYPKLSFAPVLKSNAYGHGLVEAAKILDREEKPFFVVDSIFEARVLRENNIKSKMLVIGYASPQNILANGLQKISFAIVGIEQLKELSKFPGRPVKIHLKIDTGMHRHGILPDEIAEAIKIIKDSKNIVLEGVCSHFADAGNADKSFTQKQIKIWNEAIKIAKQNFDNIKYFHLSATAGIKYSNEIEANTARLGIGLYGTTGESSLKLKPVLKMQSVISLIKTIPAVEYVGYSLLYRTEKETKVACVPAGYFEGIDKRLSNCGFYKIQNHFCPIIGRVSMNITSIDVTDVPNAKEGDRVILISDEAEDKNSVLNIAKTAGTIPYEIIVHIPQHLKRTVY
jgi:alanine racemase